jgi:hypothetical protein
MSNLYIYSVSHSLLISNAKATKLHRDEFKPSPKGQIGIMLSCDWVELYEDSPAGQAYTLVCRS